MCAHHNCRTVSPRITFVLGTYSATDVGKRCSWPSWKFLHLFLQKALNWSGRFKFLNLLFLCFSFLCFLLFKFFSSICSFLFKFLLFLWIFNEALISWPLLVEKVFPNSFWEFKLIISVFEEFNNLKLFNFRHILFIIWMLI